MSKTRISSAQREKLLNFMLAHEDLARGRVSGPVESRRKTAMLAVLATALNEMGGQWGGGTKTPEKWWKSWQDWRADTKAKALRLKKYRAGRGGGPEGGPGPAPLTQMEETLLRFCGFEMVEDVAGVADTLENLEETSADKSIIESEEEEVFENELNPEPSTSFTNSFNNECAPAPIQEKYKHPHTFTQYQISQTPTKIIQAKKQMDVEFEQLKSMSSEKLGQKRELDEYDHFAFMIAAKIRKFDNPSDREVLMNSIQNLTFEFYMKNKQIIKADPLAMQSIVSSSAQSSPKYT